MLRRRLILLGVVACAVGMLVAPSALGATPQQIYRDYADNGRLDHAYSKADLQAAQKYAALQGYPKVGVQGAVEQALGHELPAAYVALMKSQNGGIPARRNHRTKERTSWRC